MKNCKIKPSFVTQQMWLTNVVLFYDFYFNIHRKLSVIRCYTRFSEWLTTGSNPEDNNWFQSHTGKQNN